VLQLEEGKQADGGAELKAAATEGAKQGRRAATEEKGEDRPEKVNVGVSARPEKPAGEAVAAEADKGYDVMFIGIEKMRGSDGAFTAGVDRVAVVLTPLVPFSS